MRFKHAILGLALFCMVSIFFCGCATPPENLFTMSGSDWHLQQGQALWTPRKGLPQFGGDLVLATSDGSNFVEFAKTPMTIVKAQTTPKRWLIRFPQYHIAHAGHMPAPKQTLWLHLADALAGRPLPKAIHFHQQPDGNWRLENVKTGEILEGFLSS